MEEAEEEIPKDGKYTWIKGRVAGETVYGVKEADGGYHYEVRYDAGPGDLAVMEKFDIEYLSQLLREGTLREKEPDVWMLREMDGAQTRDIGSWWHEKLQLDDIGTRLEHAAHDYQQWQQQADARAKEARLVQLRSKLQTLVDAVNKILTPIQNKKQLTLLPVNEQANLKELLGYVASVQPRALDEADLDKAVAYLESWQPYLEALPQTLAPLVAEQARLAAEAAAQQRLAVLRSKLQTLLGEANKILQPIQAHSQLQLLPQNEQRTLQEFIARLASLNPAALNETSLSQGIARIEAKKQYLVDLPARIAALEAKRAEQVTALQKEIYNFNLKVKAADLASDYKAVIENCVFIQDCYEKLGALGVDCTQQLAELETQNQRGTSETKSGRYATNTANDTANSYGITFFPLIRFLCSFYQLNRSSSCFVQSCMPHYSVCRAAIRSRVRLRRLWHGIPRCLAQCRCGSKETAFGAINCKFAPSICSRS